MDINPFAQSEDNTVDYFGFKPNTLGKSQAARMGEVVQFASDGAISKEEASSAYSVGNGSSVEERLSAMESIKVNEARQAVIRDFARLKTETGGDLTPQELGVLQNLTKTDLENPGMALERAFAKKAMYTQLSTPAGQDAISDDPDANQAMDVYEEINTTNAYIQKRLLEVDSEVEKQGWGSWLGDQAKMFVIPAYEWYKTRNVALETKSFLPGSNMAEQVQYLWSLPQAERVQKIGEIVDELKGSNLQLARNFLHYVMEQSNDDTFVNNVWGILDTADIGLTAGAIAGGVKLTRLRRALKASTAAVSNPRATVQSVVQATGNVTASVVASSQNIAKRLRGDYLKDIGELRDHMDTFTPSLVNPSKEFGLAGHTPNLRAGTAGDVAEVLETNAKVAERIFTEVPNINRIEPESASWRAFVAKNVEDITNTLGTARTHTIKDVAVLPSGDSAKRVSTMVVDIAKPDGNNFANKAQADFWRTNVLKVPKGETETVQVGNEFVVRYKTPMREDLADIYDALLVDTQTKTPDRWSNMAMNYFRSSMGPLSPASRSAKVQLANSFAPIHGLMDVMMRPQRALNSTEGKRIHSLLNDARDRGIKSNTQGFAKDIGSFEMEYISKFKEAPSANEVAAYFSAKQLMDVDYMVRNHALYAEKSALGVKKFTFNRIKGATDFEGKTVKSLPDFDQRYQPRIYDADTNTIIDLRGQSLADYNMIRKGYEDGRYKIVELYHHQANPLGDILEKANGYRQGRYLEPVQYVVSKNLKTSPLSPKQLEYRDGVHARYLDENYIKVPIIVGNRYYGDTTIMSARWDKDANSLVKFLNEARILYKAERANKVPAGSLDALFNSKTGSSFPIDVNDFKAMYHGPKALDLSQPFETVKAGTKFRDNPKFKDMGLVDMTSRYSLGDSIQLQYLGERGDGVASIKTVDGGTRGGPLLERADDNLMDANRIIQQSLTTVIESTYFNDYRIKAVNEWISNFSDVFTESAEEMRKAPLYYLHNPPWNEVGADPQLLSRAKWHRTSTLLLHAEKSAAQKAIDLGKSKVLNSIREKWGKDKADWLDDAGIFKYRDPVRALKSLAFHSKIGIYNPVHFFLNMGTLVHLVGVEPKGAMKAFRVAYLLHPLLHNRSQKMFDRMMKISGMNPQHFKELYDGMLEGGWAHMHSRASNYVDDYGAWKGATSTVGRMLDQATFFYTEGERIIRKSAYTTAYMAWRDRNPKALFDAKAKAWVNDRANTLSVDMTTASTNQSQRGLLSIPTQFMSYQMRLAEEVLTGIISNNKSGTGLTRAEALRSMALNAIWYGVPTGIGIPLAVMPIYDIVKKELTKNNIDPEQSIYSDMFVNGLGQALVNQLTGTNMNFSERYGPGSLSQISDAISGETTVLEVLAGPGGTIAMDFVKAARPGVAYMASAFFNDSADEKDKINVNLNDILDFARNISTVNNFLKAYYAFQFGQYISKSEIPMMEGLDLNDAVWIGVFGLTPTEVTKAYSMREIMMSRRDAAIEAAKQVDKLMQRMARSEDLAERAALRKKAFLWLELSGVDPLERRAIFQKALSRYGMEADRIHQRFNDQQNRLKQRENQN